MWSCKCVYNADEKKNRRATRKNSIFLLPYLRRYHATGKEYLDSRPLIRVVLQEKPYHFLLWPNHPPDSPSPEGCTLAQTTIFQRLLKLVIRLRNCFPSLQVFGETFAILHTSHARREIRRELSEFSKEGHEVGYFAKYVNFAAETALDQIPREL